MVADSAARARDAAELVEVEYETLPIVTSAVQAVAEGGPPVWEDCPDNICYRRQVGDTEAVDAAIGVAAHVTHTRLPISRVCMNPMEPRAALGRYDESTERYTLHTGSQNPHAMPTAPYRGAGRPEAALAIEHVIDQAARELGIDRVALRRRNLIPSEALPFQTGLSYRYDCGEFERNMDEALASIDLDGFASRRTASEASGRLRGLGIANTIEQSAGVTDEWATIRFDPSGSATVFLGTHSHGQGHETVFRQLVGERLGLDFGQIHYVQGDTDQVPYGGGTGGSRVAVLGGAALTRAADRILEQGRRLAAHSFECAPDDVGFAEGRFEISGTDRSLSLRDVVRIAFSPALRPPDVEGGLSASAGFHPSGPTFPTGCHVCEVEIDPETGALEMQRYCVVEDVGTVLNPMLLRGQLQGGIVQGFGQIVLERFVLDEAGQPLTGSFMDYAMPRADEAPFAEIALRPVPTALNPLGAKGAGEAGTVGGMPCVMSAILDALRSIGAGDFEMPATPERIWRAIRRARTRVSIDE